MIGEVAYSNYAFSRCTSDSDSDMIRGVKYELECRGHTLSGDLRSGRVRGRETGAQRRKPRSPSAATAAVCDSGVAGDEVPKNMCFCETNPNYSGSKTGVNTLWSNWMRSKNENRTFGFVFPKT